MQNLQACCSYQEFYIIYYKSTYDIELKKLYYSSKDKVYLISCKFFKSSILEVQRNLGKGFRILDMRIGIIKKTLNKTLSKSHYVLVSQMVFIVVKVTGKSKIDITGDKSKS